MYSSLKHSAKSSYESQADNQYFLSLWRRLKDLLGAELIYWVPMAIGCVPSKVPKSNTSTLTENIWSELYAWIYANPRIFLRDEAAVYNTRSLFVQLMNNPKQTHG